MSAAFEALYTVVQLQAKNELPAQGRSERFSLGGGGGVWHFYLNLKNVLIF